MGQIENDLKLLGVLTGDNSQEERDKAWTLLLQDPYPFNFVYLICHALREEDKEKAWQELLKVTPQVSRDNLCAIMTLATEKWQEKAWQQLLAQPHKDFDFVYLVCEAPERYKQKAWQELLKLNRNISLNNLYWIISCTSSRWQKLAWQKFLEQEPAPTDEILRKALSLTQYRAIASYLLEKNTSEEEAVWNAAYVLEFCNSRKLKEKAWHYLKCHPKKEVLLFLVYEKRLPLHSKYLKAVMQLLESLEKDKKDENTKSS